MKSIRRTVGAILTASGMVLAGTTAFMLTPAAASPATPSGASAQSMAASSAASFVSSHAAAMHVGSGDTLTQRPVISSDGLQYVTYDRTYRGLPVFGGEVTLMTNSTGAVLANSVGQDQTIGNLSTTPKLSAAAAQSVATNQLKVVSQVEGAPQLAVYGLGTPRLVWQTTVNGSTATEKYSRQTVYVDAMTGAVVQSVEHVAYDAGTTMDPTTNATAVGTWEGTKSIRVTGSVGSQTMRDPNTTSLTCQTSLTGSTLVSSTTGTFGSGTGTDAVSGCADAFYTAEIERDMLSHWLGRTTAMNGSGGAWPIKVALNDENAFYDGTQVQVGHNTANQWIGSLDVVGHEMGHGVDDHTGAGGVSGGNTQEFVADTFGATSEWYANTSDDAPDFTVGEEVNLVGTGPIRNMANPSANGDDNCWSTSTAGEEVHAAAGPGNHWFYMLAEGTTAFSTTVPGSTPCATVSGLSGMLVPGDPRESEHQAMRIMYNGMLLKTGTAGYGKYRVWTLTAAKALDASCVLFNRTKAAWDAVLLGAQAGEPTCSSGPTPLALANPGTQSGTVGVATSLTLSATGGTTPYTFSATGLPTGLSIAGSTGVISGTPSAAGTFSVSATVTDSATPTHATATVSFSWVISPTGTCSSPGQKIVNGGFESGTSPWTATAGVLGNTSGQTAHTGTQYAWMDGYGTTHTDTLQQTITIPAGCKATVTYWLHIDTAETTTTTQFDKFTSLLGATSVGSFSNLNHATGYVSHTTGPISGLSGSVVLKFTGTEDSSLQTSFVVDDVTVTLS